MSMRDVRFTCTTLKGGINKGKKGILKPNADGYYVMPIGGLNVWNSAGEYYVYEGAKQLFEQSSSFMRRVSSGCLKSEEGHPQPLPNQSMESFANRVMKIDEKNVCAHIASVYLDFNSVLDANGRPIVAIMGEIKPAGPHGDALAESFQNPKEEICFSIRAFTNDNRVGGVNQRTLAEIVTFDRVTEPGIATSRKYHSPALESFVETRFTQEAMVKATTPMAGIAMESNILAPQSLFKMMGWSTDHMQDPSYLKW